VLCAAAVLFAVAFGAGACASLRFGRAAAAPPARNVILLIGDGLGAAALTMARNYHLGAAGRMHIDELPATGSCTTYAVTEEDPRRPDYVADSAASATALATGRKTSNRRVATEVGTDAPLPTVLELAQRAGFRTGLVSTSTLADATPAAFASHIDYRWCHGPASMSACPKSSSMFGGPGSIVEQLVETRPDVLFGGGRALFAQPIPAGPHAGRTVAQAAVARGYRVIETAADIATLAPGAPALGLFAEDNFTPIWLPSLASFPAGPAERCRPAERPADQPTLVQMLEAALRLLSPGDSEGPGFFLMAEAAMIDKRAHSADACGQIGETVELDRAVAVARSFAEKNPGTLLIVVGDHDHTPQIVDPKYAAYVPGMTTTLATADGAPMTIAYATSYFGMSQQHTGTQLPVFAFGPDADEVIGLIDQTDIFRIMLQRLGLDDAAAGRGAK